MRTELCCVDCQTKNEVFAQARDAEVAAEELLVDDGWKPVEFEPETVSVNGNGHADTLGIGPAVELFPADSEANANGNSHGPAPVNGSGYHDAEGLAAQQTLFSWAEFMAEESDKPKGRSRKPQPATASLFEWALGMEQEVSRPDAPIDVKRRYRAM